MSELLRRIDATARHRGWTPALETPQGIVDYHGLKARVDALGRHLVDGGCRHLALLLDNEPEWLFCQLAAFKAGIPVTPIPHFFSDDQVRHLLQTGGVDLVISREPARLAALDLGFEPRPEIHPLAFAARTPAVPLPEQTALITFTSGTTGRPKGVCLDAALLDSRCHDLWDAVATAGIHRHASLLPLPVLLENLAGALLALWAGECCLLTPLADLGLAGSGLPDPRRLAAHLERLQPDSLILVPELLKLLIGLVEAGAYRHRLKFVAVGGARLSPLMLQRADALGIPVYQGYGLSECGSVVALNRPDANRRGSVGRPLAHSAVTLAEDGEIRVRGPRMLGYLGEPPAADPWIATGDLGSLDDDGYLYLHGRKKNLLINSFGRNLSPEWVEAELTASPLILQACLYGDARPFNVALLTPAPGCPAQAIDQWLETLNRQLPDYARIRRWLPSRAPFGVANGQLTANGRLKRHAIYGDYADDFDRCYG